MERMIEHRGAPRVPARLDAVIEYFPRRTADSGRWWENFAVRTVNLSEGGVQFTAADRLAPGGRIRMILPPDRDGASTVELEGDVVWVHEPALPWLGRYRVGISFRPALQTGVAPLLQRAESSGEPVIAG